MSWSISLGGPREVVLKELSDAAEVINQAGVAVKEVHANQKDSIHLSVSGYVSWDDKGITASSTSHSVSVSRYTPPIPPREATASEAPSEQ